ncbi:MAG: transcription antitermination factor NusB [Prevotella sp.]|nr:transcription antitermination factor NusB [Prevotella sp.]
MINREIIRIKIVQLTYAYYQNGNKNIDSAEKELFFSLSKAYDLYNYLLALIVAITKEAGRRLEVAQARAKREGLPEPSQKFVFNRFALQLGENKALQDFLSTQKFAWEDSAVFLGQILETIESSETYKTYMASDEDSYEADRELWRKLYKTIITDNADLDAILEDQSLYWNDDKEIVDTFVLKTIKRFKEQNGAKEELLPEWDSEEEKDFARKLFRSAILNADQYQHYMSEASRNWDFSRLAYMDVILMQIAIAEMMTFPNVPISVSINEYVDIAKLYSTKKSGGYINGMLDAIARNLIKTGRLMKHMDPKEPKATKEKKDKVFYGEKVTQNGQPKKMRHRIKKGEEPQTEKEDKQ